MKSKEGRILQVKKKERWTLSLISLSSHLQDWLEKNVEAFTEGEKASLSHRVQWSSLGSRPFI